MKKYLELLNQKYSLEELYRENKDNLVEAGDKGRTESKKEEIKILKEENTSLRKQINETIASLKINENKRINKEFRRINKVFKEYETNNFVVVAGLMRRAAFMLVQLENYEQDIMQNGSVEPFSQGDQAPYDRARPVVQQYATMNSNYQKIMKQLSDLLPNNEKKDSILEAIDALRKPK